MRIDLKTWNVESISIEMLASGSKESQRTNCPGAATKR